MSKLCGRRAIVARSSRSPISVRNRGFPTNRDKFNRQTPELERFVTRRKQRILLSSNRQKIRFCKTINFAATEASTASLRPFPTGLPRAFFAKGSVCPRPFLTGSGSQTEFDVTHSKQTTEKFLTGARMHIKDFEVCTRRTQREPARRGGLARVNLPVRRARKSNELARRRLIPAGRRYEKRIPSNGAVKQ